MSTIDSLAADIMNELMNYCDDITDGVKSAVDIVAPEVNEEIKRHITFKQPTGKYVKAFRIKTTSDGRYNRGKTWHVADPHYRRTHLLEDGHVLRNGGRSRAFPHIIYGEELAQRRMGELSIKAVENANQH